MVAAIVDSPQSSKEKDPDGLDQHSAGAKLDAGKIRVSLLKRFGLAFMAMAELATVGAEKYTDNGWAEVENGAERYDDAMFSHYLREVFEDEDSDTKVHHAVATLWNAAARLQFLIGADPEWKARLMSRKMPARGPADLMSFAEEAPPRPSTEEQEC